MSTPHDPQKNLREKEAMTEDLKAYVDGELDAERTAEIARFLEIHPDQKREVIYLQEMTNVLKTEMEKPEPSGLEKTLEALDKGAAKPVPPVREGFLTRFSRNPGNLVWTGMAACLVLAFWARGAVSHLGGGPVASDSASSTATLDANKEPAPEAMKSMAKAATSDEAPAQSRRGFGRTGSFGGAASDPSLETRSQAKSVNGSMGEGFGSFAHDDTVGSIPSRLGNRKIARNAQLGIRVDNAQQAESRAEDVLRNYEADIWGSNLSQNPQPVIQTGVQTNPPVPVTVATAYIEADVPSAHLDEAVRDLSKLGEVRVRSIQASDMTAQIADVKKELAAVQNRYDEDGNRIKGVTRVKDIKRLEELRSEAREQLRDLTAQKENLAKQVQMSHVSLTLTQETAPVNPNDTWVLAKQSLAEFGGTVVQFLIFALVFSPVWIPVGLIAMYLSKRNAPKA